jgi:uridylate kinase
MHNTKKLLLKISWEALKGTHPYGFDVDFMKSLSKDIADLHTRGMSIVIVVWWWNFFRWKTGEELGMERAAADYIGMLSTVMNSLALAQTIQMQGKKVLVLSAIDMPTIAESRRLESALDALQQWTIVICAWGIGVPYISSDLGAVTRGLELQCDVLVKATKVDGVYDKDPMTNTDAKKYKMLALQDALKQWLNVMDHAAIALAMDHQLPLYVCHISHISDIGTEDMNGTRVN